MDEYDLGRGAGSLERRRDHYRKGEEVTIGKGQESLEEGVGFTVGRGRGSL